MRRSRRKIPAAVRYVQLRLLYPPEYVAYLAERQRRNIFRYPENQPKETAS